MNVIGQDTTEYKSIDIARLVIAAIVVGIHCGVKNYSIHLYNISQATVTCFFVISGYFVDDKIRKTGQGYILGYLKKSWSLYWRWTIVYMPILLYYCITNGIPWSKDCIIVLRQFLLIGGAYGSEMLWYILALIWGVMGLYFIVYQKPKENKTILLITILILLIGYLLEYTKDFFLSSIYFDFFGTTRNGFFQGFPFLVIGVLLNRYDIISRCKNNKILIIFILLVLVPMASCLHPTKSLFLTPLICGLSMALFFSIHLPIPMSTKPIRDISIWLFFVHMYVLFIFRLFRPYENVPVSFLLILSVSAFFSYCLYKLSFKYKMLRSWI